MASIIGQRIRAQITIGGLIVRTPNVVSFNVRRARNQMAATFSASLKIPYTTSNNIGADIVIEAGLKGNLKKIFTGTIEKSTVNPIRTDASMVMLNISGRDVLAVMEGQKINRRVKTYRDGSNPPERWGIINSVAKHNTSKMEKFPIFIEDNKPKATQKLPQQPLDVTPAPYRLENAVDRSRGKVTYGGLSVQKIIEE
jgi:hypothetical protein